VLKVLSLIAIKNVNYSTRKRSFRSFKRFTQTV
jgi:hypothetical protein